MSEYGFVKEVDMRVEELCAMLPEALQAEGFGVISQIDLGAKLKEKTGTDIGSYVIYGVCNPPNALKAVTAEPAIGLLLPCNVAAYEKNGRTFFAVIRPTVAMGMVDNEQLEPVAQEVEERLRRVFEAVR